MCHLEFLKKDAIFVPENCCLKKGENRGKIQLSLDLTFMYKLNFIISNKYNYKAGTVKI